jgi:hypothetical protein
MTEATWPALVSREAWHDVRATLTDPGRRTRRAGRDKHLASMIATCGKCGGQLSVRYRDGAGGYVCRARGCVKIRQDALDGFLTALVLGRLSDPGEYGHVTARDDSGPQVAALRDQLADLRARADQLAAAVASGEISVTLAARAEPPILAGIAATENALREAEAPSGLVMLGLNPGADIAARWDGAPMTARREVLRTLFSSITVAPAGRHSGIAAADRVSVTWR